MAGDTFKCSKCKARKPIHKEGGTGYALRGKRRICYACASALEAREMDRTGRAVLYLTHERMPDGSTGPYVVTDWPGLLRFKVDRSKEGRHNIARTRTDVWFTDSAGAQWHGVNLGQWSEILRCKRVTEEPPREILGVWDNGGETAETTTRGPEVMTADEAFYLRAISVPCPRCLASAGRPCVDPRGETVDRHGRMVKTHATRIARATKE